MSRLDAIIETTRQDVEIRRRQLPESELRSRLGAHRDDRPFAEALSRPGMSLIAEHKRRSPSAGAIREDLSLEQVVKSYEAGGAAAISVLTESRGFGGSLEDLAAARLAVDLPILRKDFIVDPYQLLESAVWGADAILLIVAALHPDDLAELFEEATSLDLDVLVEIHNRDELEVALRCGAELIGINSRDLGDFTVDISRTFELIKDVPAGKTVVGESGFSTRDQVEELESVGVDAVLVGEALMRSDDLEAAARRLLTGLN